jgi:hypothetical protein
MRKLGTTSLVLILSGLGAIAAAAAPKPADQPRTMEDVIDRVITNENRATQQIKQYSPLVETYIQNLKPDKELGYVPAGDKYFLGRADFNKGVALVSLTDTNTKGKKDLRLDRQLLFLRDAVHTGRLPADDFYRHEWIRQAALQV